MATGAVTGTLGFTDPAGLPLTYTVTTNPAQGSVAVTTAGAYTYTPTQAARLTAGTMHTGHRHLHRHRRQRSRLRWRNRHRPSLAPAGQRYRRPSPSADPRTR